MGKTHALVIPFPAQGHINPLMKLSHRLVEHGFTITFVNTDFNHSRVVAALEESGEEFRGIRLVSIPDGMAPGEDRNQMGKVYDAVEHTGASYVEALICEINANGGDHITCVIADATYWPALKVAGKLGIRGAAFCPASAGSLATAFSIPKLVEDGILDVNGMQSQVTTLLNLANVQRKQVQHPTRYKPLNHSRSKAYNDLRMSNKKKSARLSKSPKNHCWSFIYCLCPTILDGAAGMQLGASAVPSPQQMRLWPCGTGSFACTCSGVIGGACAPPVCTMGLCHIGTGESVVPSAQQRPRAGGMKDIMFE